MALSFYGTLIAASKKSECLEIEPDFDTVGIQIATEMLQLPGSTPTPPLAQTAAFGPLPFQKALWSGQDHRIGAGDSASRAVSSELHLSWNLCFLRGSAPGQPSVPVLTPACLPGLRPILSPGVQVRGHLLIPHYQVSHYVWDTVLCALGT